MNMQISLIKYSKMLGSAHFRSFNMRNPLIKFSKFGKLHPFLLMNMQISLIKYSKMLGSAHFLLINMQNHPH